MSGFSRFRFLRSSMILIAGLAAGTTATAAEPVLLLAGTVTNGEFNLTAVRQVR